jgi:hypothetical protein
MDYDNWIKIEDKLPEPNKRFIALWDDDEISIEIWHKTDNVESFNAYTKYCKNKILGWLPHIDLPIVKINLKEQDSGL